MARLILKRLHRDRSLLVTMLLGAAAVGLWEVDRADAACSGNIITNVLMNTNLRADFGNDPHLFGSPTTPAKICWQSVGSTQGAIVEGQLYYDDLFRAGCAFITITFQTASGQTVSQFSEGVCSPGGLRQKSVFSQVNGRVRVIFINLFQSNSPTSPKTDAGAKRFAIP